ncbi:MAG TPA: molybdate ABC transporter substrate-binding protein [Steroidobacteraceae bacterium]|nr:molybdate ABC transporter substrate-binding protein [Steroidobacteraceae bacterium]
MRRREMLATAVAAVLVETAAARLARAASGPPLLVFGAASLTNALRAVAAACRASGGPSAVLTFAASSTLARQIEAGAPADVFFSADTDWMDYLEARHLIEPATRRDIVGNRLALIAPAASRIALTVTPGFALRAALGAGRLALGDPAGVPAGRYARSALRALGVWSSVADRLAPAENVRAALEYVARAAAPLGIVYETDALIEPRVRIVALIPQADTPPIVYPAAVVKGARAAAPAFLAYLRSPAAQGIFHNFGFSSP